jgi:hypothetical protein
MVMASYNNFRRTEKKFTVNEAPKDYNRDIVKRTGGHRSFEEMKDDWRAYCSYWKSYPDKFIDFIKPHDCKIDLYFYQRIMLRVLFRYRKVYFTFTRGTAKSFTQILALYLKCIMNPSTHLFICAPTKEQAAKISQENIKKIWQYYPILRSEIKDHKFGLDITELEFHNGSRLDVVIVANSARGGRRNGGAIEEIVDEKLKKDELNSVVIPLMANDRLSSYKDPKTGSRVDPSEIHKFQFYVTTSGTRQSFAFEKLKEIQMEMARGESSISLGASYELACMHGQLDLKFINELKNQPTFNPLSFAREYESVWTGTSDNSLVQLEDLKMCRTLEKAEEKAEKGAEYILSYDVSRSEGKQNAMCALCVIKLIPRSDGTYQKHLVNIYSFEGTHFLEQALFIKKKVNDFKARMLVVDANGAGTGLIDILVTECDANPAYSVVNDDRYDKYKTANSIPILFALKSQNKETRSSDIHNVFVNMISGHKVKMLYSESEAKANLDKKLKEKAKANGKNEDDADSLSEYKSRMLMPYVYTDLLCEEIMNLEYKQAGSETKVKQISRGINKDKFSAFEYGLYYTYLLEKGNQIKKKETVDAFKFFLVKKPKSSL